MGHAEQRERVDEVRRRQAIAVRRARAELARRYPVEYAELVERFRVDAHRQRGELPGDGNGRAQWK